MGHYLSLLGYEDLSDIVLQFISGEHQVCREKALIMYYCFKESQGLRLLEKLVLPNKSYITELGVLSLLQNLQFLQILEFPGHSPHFQFTSNS